MKKTLDKNEPATDAYTVLSAGDKLELLKNFLTEHFDFKELKKAGFYKDINKTEYEKQAKRICDFFGYETVYEFGFNTTYAHITYADGHRPEGEPFLTEFKAWHED